MAQSLHRPWSMIQRSRAHFYFLPLILVLVTNFGLIMPSYADFNDQPQICQLTYIGKKQGQFQTIGGCSGTLASMNESEMSRHLVTAGHCDPAFIEFLDQYSDVLIQINCGSKMQVIPENEFSSHIVSHPKYYDIREKGAIAERKYFPVDLAVITLPEPMRIPPMIIASKEQSEMVYEKTDQCFIAGYGRMLRREIGDSSQKPSYQSPLNLFDQRDMDNLMYDGIPLKKGNIVAGDSGGPLVCGGNLLVAVHSYGALMGMINSTTAVFLFRDWFQSEMTD